MEKKKKAGIAISVLLAIIIMTVPVMAEAMTSKVSVQVYKPANNLILEPETKGQILSVQKFTFTFKGRESFSSVERIIKNLNAAHVNPESMKWISSNEKVAKVNSRGTVTGIKRGSAYVYPIPRGVYSYKTKGKYITYLSGNISYGFRLYGGIGAKVKVTK